MHFLMLLKRGVTWNIVFFLWLADVALKGQPVAHVASQLAETQTVTSGAAVLFFFNSLFEFLFLGVIKLEETHLPCDPPAVNLKLTVR